LCVFSISFYREEEKNYASIDRKYTVKQDLVNSTVSQANHNRTTTPANQWAELDSNPNTSNQSTSSPSSLHEKSYNSGSTIQERDIELEAASHLLTKQEKSLCIQLDLKPTQYLTQKTLLLQVSDESLIITFFYYNYNIYYNYNFANIYF